MSKNSYFQRALTIVLEGREDISQSSCGRNRVEMKFDGYSAMVDFYKTAPDRIKGLHEIHVAHWDSLEGRIYVTEAQLSLYRQDIVRIVTAIRGLRYTLEWLVLDHNEAYELGELMAIAKKIKLKLYIPEPAIA